MHSHILIHVMKDATPRFETLHMCKTLDQFCLNVQSQAFWGDGIHDIKHKLVDFSSLMTTSLSLGLTLKINLPYKRRNQSSIIHGICKGPYSLTLTPQARNRKFMWLSL